MGLDSARNRRKRTAVRRAETRTPIIRLMRRADLRTAAMQSVKVFCDSTPTQALKVMEASFSKRVDGACLVAVARGRIVGAIFGEEILHWKMHSAHLHSFYVLPAYRKRGLGAALFSRCVAALERAGMKNLSLTLYDRGAARMYRRAGFRESYRTMTKEVG